MKTLIVYETIPDGETKFFLVDGDRFELDGCFINTVGVEKKYTAKILAEVSTAEVWGVPLKTPFMMTGTQPVRVVNCGFIN